MNANAQRADAALAVVSLAQRFAAVRSFTESLAAGLSPEDCQIQSMEAASPVKWHLAHTTWFFETLVLTPHAPRYEAFNPAFRDLFNSYYNHVGVPFTRRFRGFLSRPSLHEVLAWRKHVNGALLALLEKDHAAEVDALVELGLNHEQQHQELILTDLLHAFSHNPLTPVYRPAPAANAPAGRGSLRWKACQEGIVTIGAADDGFAFDNERPRHRELLASYALADRLVTNAEYREFVESGAYRKPTLWLSDGWATVQAEGWERPLYWSADLRRAFTLHGTQPLLDNAPVCHLSYYEADAFARWAGARLPTEAEWEHAAAGLPMEGHFVDSGVLVPTPCAAVAGDAPRQMFGDVWEWTQSAYGAYPGYRAPDGAVGEYNGKFMCNQLVLRGGSLASSQDHLRASYRNFFPASARWQFSGLRLAKDGA
ncbi:MAG TPA: ergothioneine biosynthesis protein EgtB [Nevskiaceae bacterium]